MQWLGRFNDFFALATLLLGVVDGHLLTPIVSRLKREATASGIPNEYIKLIVEKHNALRAAVDPPATDMKYMTWDTDLADLAQSWTCKCTEDHSDGPDGYQAQQMGENLAAGTASGGLTDLTSMANTWYDEIQYYTYSTDQCSANEAVGQSCGHYYQVVFADAYAVGCGYTQCSSMTYGGQATGSKWVLVCNYKSAVSSGQPYEDGTSDGSSSNCASGWGTQVDGDKLCARDGGKCDGLSCQNGGTMDDTNCVCDCPDGFTGALCEKTQAEFGCGSGCDGISISIVLTVTGMALHFLI